VACLKTDPANRAVAAVAALAIGLLCLGSVGEAHGQALGASDQAAAISQAAMARYKEKNFKLCAELYLQAFRLDTRVVGYLYGAARCQQKDGQLLQAEHSYEQVAKAATNDFSLAERAKTRWYQLRTARLAREEQARKAAAAKAAREKAAAAKAAKVAAAKAAAAKAAREKAARQAELDRRRAAAATSNVKALLAGGLGVVALASGGWLLMDGLARGDELESDLAKLGPSGKIAGVNHETAVERQAGANLRTGVGTGLLIAGAAAVGTGVYLLLAAPEPAAAKPAASKKSANAAPKRPATTLRIVPTFSGALVEVRF